MKCSPVMHSSFFLNILLLFSACFQTTDTTNNQSMNNNTSISTDFYSFQIPALTGDHMIQMSDFKGKKILLVNVASRCGYTGQYKDLQKLHAMYGDQVQIIGLPCNQFMGQEPGSNEEIAQFCKSTYDVTFPLTQKIDVRGDNQHPIYQWLTQKKWNQLHDFKVSWNFNKFLMDENGKLIGHFGSGVEPLSPELLKAIGV